MSSNSGALVATDAMEEGAPAMEQEDAHHSGSEDGDQPPLEPKMSAAVLAALDFPVGDWFQKTKILKRQGTTMVRPRTSHGGDKGNLNATGPADWGNRPDFNNTRSMVSMRNMRPAMPIEQLLESMLPAPRGSQGGSRFDVSTENGAAPAVSAAGNVLPELLLPTPPSRWGAPPQVPAPPSSQGASAAPSKMPSMSGTPAAEPSTIPASASAQPSNATLNTTQHSFTSGANMPVLPPLPPLGTDGELSQPPSARHVSKDASRLSSEHGAVGAANGSLLQPHHNHPPALSSVAEMSSRLSSDLEGSLPQSADVAAIEAAAAVIKSNLEASFAHGLPSAVDVPVDDGAEPQSPSAPLAPQLNAGAEQSSPMPLGGKKLVTSWHFEEMTEDGGVGITFDGLEGETESNLPKLEALHEALQNMVAAQADEAEEDAEDDAKALAGHILPGPIEGVHVPLPPSLAVAMKQATLRVDEDAGKVVEAEKAEAKATHPAEGPAAAAVATTSAAAAGKAAPMASPAPAAPPAGPAAAAAAAREKAVAQLTSSLRNKMALTIKVAFHTGKLRPLNIVMMIVGTRGDVQPFIGIGLKLKEYGHRVRLATHAVYREFVTGFGLEFYPLGGDPKVLSEFVVKHRGIMPGWDVRDALQQREQVRQILFSTWGACVSADPERPNKPFIADAIVANPPCYGHSHCAEALNVPLHVVFTMPWTPTKVFPQPFARIRTVMGQTNSKAREVMNWLSYFAMEDLAWLGMAGMVKDYRQRVLGLKSWNKLTTSHAIYHSKVPVTYIWSPSLVPRPSDWPTYCEVVGFINVDLKGLTSYTPPKELKEFLEAGPPPVYIGFGSLVLDQPDKLTESFLEALKRTGLRGIIQRGWGGLGSSYGKQGNKQAPKDVLFIDNAAHDWLFERVCAVVHHGGAGTTATGLYAGKPTFIVPFFGDQPFWGAAVARVGAGPDPVPIDDLNTNRIVDALKELILPTRKKAAEKISERMHMEDGVAATVDHIHRTIYGALVGGRGPVWMRPGGLSAASRSLGGDGDAADGTQRSRSDRPLATTAIEELEDDQGNALRGIFHLPVRVIKSVSNFFGRTGSTLSDTPGINTQANRTPKTPASELNAGRARSTGGGLSSVGSPSPPTPSQARSAGGSQRPTAEVVDMPKRGGGGLFAFLGC